MKNKLTHKTPRKSYNSKYQEGIHHHNLYAHHQEYGAEKKSFAMQFFLLGLLFVMCLIIIGKSMFPLPQNELGGKATDVLTSTDEVNAASLPEKTETGTSAESTGSFYIVAATEAGDIAANLVVSNRDTDFSFIGVTPVSVGNLPASRNYWVAITKDGYKPNNLQVPLKQGETVKVKVKLTSLN